MTPAEWHASVDVGAMLEAVGETAGDHPDRAFYGQAPVRATERQLRLWVVALFDLSTHDYDADGWADTVDCWRQGEQGPDTWVLPTYAASLWANTAHNEPGDPPMALRAHLLRDVVGDPFAPTIVPKSCDCTGPTISGGIRLVAVRPGAKCLCGQPLVPWLTPTVRALAETCDAGDWSALGALSDVLEEVGCPDGPLLRYLRGLVPCDDEIHQSVGGR